MPTFINLFTLSIEPWSIGCAGMTRLAVIISLLLGLMLLFSSASGVAAKVSNAAEAGRIADPSLCVVDVVGAAAAAAAAELTFGGVANGAGVEDGRSTMAL